MQGHGFVNRTNETTGEYLNATLEWLVQNDPQEYGKLKRSCCNQTTWTKLSTNFLVVSIILLDNMDIQQSPYRGK